MLNRWQRTIVDLRGNVVPYAQLQVRVEATQAAASIYRDSAGTEAIPNGIVTANAQGYAYFYAPAGLYRITSAEPVIDWRDVNIGSAEAAQLTGGDDADFAAMPKVGGSPIVESGSNANGSWTKWADGTMLCWMVTTSIVPIDGTEQVRYSQRIGFVFPQEFYATPRCWGSAGEYIAWASAYGQNKSEVYSRAIWVSSVPGSVSVLAIGRWKA